MSKKSKVESSDHFNEILDMKKKGLSPGKISAYLLDEYNESIHRNTINNYFRNLDEKVAAEYYKQQKAKDEKNKSKVDEVVDSEVANKEAVADVIKKGVEDINVLDDFIGLAEKVELDPTRVQVEYGPRGGVVVSEFDVLKANALVADIAMKAVQLKTNILKDEDKPPDINIFSLDGFDDDERQDIKKLAQSLAKSDTVE